MSDPQTLLWFMLKLLFYVGPFVVLFTFLHKRQTETAAWEQSPAGQRHREALDSWLLCKARLERAEPTGEPPVIRVGSERRRMQSGKQMLIAVREERRPMRLHVRLLPIGGGEVVTEAVVPIITTELADLTPGKIFSVLYDPGDPRRFYVDTLRRDELLMDGATMRTRAAEDNQRAALAFAKNAGG